MSTYEFRYELTYQKATRDDLLFLDGNKKTPSFRG